MWPHPDAQGPAASQLHLSLEHCSKSVPEPLGHLPGALGPELTDAGSTLAPGPWVPFLLQKSWGTR